MCHVYNLDEYSGYRNLYWYLTEFAATRLKWLFVKDLRVYGQISRKPLSFLADGYRNFAVPTPLLCPIQSPSESPLTKHFATQGGSIRRQ